MSAPTDESGRGSRGLFRSCYNHMRRHGRIDACLEMDHIALACLDAREGKPWPSTPAELVCRRLEIEAADVSDTQEKSRLALMDACGLGPEDIPS